MRHSACVFLNRVIREGRPGFREVTDVEDREPQRARPSHLRYPSDLTDEEWADVAPLIPPAKRDGNKRSVNVREVINGIIYVLSNGGGYRGNPSNIRHLAKAARGRARRPDLSMVPIFWDSGPAGGRFQRTCRRAARCSTISLCGAPTARSIASIGRFVWRSGSDTSNLSGNIGVNSKV
jgi:transposase